MKGLLITGVLLWSCASALGQQAFVDFNSGTTDSFNLNFLHYAATSHVSTLAFTPASGINDQPAGAAGGGVTATPPSSTATDVTAIYAQGGTAATFNVDDGNVHTVSMFVREGPGILTGINNKTLQVGFLADGGSRFQNGDTFISARLLGGNQIDFESDTGGGATAATSLQTGVISGISVNDWLELIFTAKQTSPGTYAGSFSLLDYGSTGLADPVTLLSPVSYAGESNATGLTRLERSGLVAGFRTAETTSTTATISYDNFAVSVPEPTSVAMVMSAAGMLCCRGRRRRIF